MPPTYVTVDEVKRYLPQVPVDTTSKPTQAQVEATGIPDSEAEFEGRIGALGFALPLTNTAALAWAQFVVSLMAAAWTLEARAAGIGGDAAFQSAKYFRDRVNEQFRLLAAGDISFDPETGDDTATQRGFIRGGQDDEPRATIRQKF